MTLIINIGGILIYSSGAVEGTVETSCVLYRQNVCEEFSCSCILIIILYLRGISREALVMPNVWSAYDRVLQYGAYMYQYTCRRQNECEHSELLQFMLLYLIDSIHFNSYMSST